MEILAKIVAQTSKVLKKSNTKPYIKYSAVITTEGAAKGKDVSVMRTLVDADGEVKTKLEPGMIVSLLPSRYINDAGNPCVSFEATPTSVSAENNADVLELMGISIEDEA